MISTFQHPRTNQDYGWWSTLGCEQCSKGEKRSLARTIMHADYCRNERGGEIANPIRQMRHFHVPYMTNLSHFRNLSFPFVESGQRPRYAHRVSNLPGFAHGPTFLYQHQYPPPTLLTRMYRSSAALPLLVYNSSPCQADPEAMGLLDLPPEILDYGGFAHACAELGAEG